MSFSFEAVVSGLVGLALVVALYVIFCRAIRRDERRHFGFPHELPLHDASENDCTKKLPE
jgi:hypothetical protein